MIPAPEFERLQDRRTLPEAPLAIRANPAECVALAARFDLVAVHSLTATLTLAAAGAVISAHGTLNARITQSCAVSGEDLPQRISTPVTFRFVPDTTHRPDEELEVNAQDCDEIPYTGTLVDLGEALAQSLALAIDPFATGPHADQARARLLDAEPTGPFAALAALKKGA